MPDKAIIVFSRDGAESMDLEVPLSITANELVNALNRAYQLGINTENMRECYLQAEAPVALLRGNKTLDEFGIHDGSHVYFTGHGGSL